MELSDFNVNNEPKTSSKKSYKVTNHSRRTLDDVTSFEDGGGDLELLKSETWKNIENFGRKMITGIDHFVSIVDDGETFMDLAFERSTLHTAKIQGIQKIHFRLFFEVYEGVLLSLIDRRIYRSKVRCSCIKFLEFLYYSMTFSLRHIEMDE